MSSKAISKWRYQCVKFKGIFVNIMKVEKNFKSMHIAIKHSLGYW